MKETVSQLIAQYSLTKDDQYFEELFKRFVPLINAYSRKLYYLDYEDSFQELSIALFDAVRKIPQKENEFACISYINTTIRHRFIKLYHQSLELREIPVSELFDSQLCHFYDHLDFINNTIFEIDLQREMAERPKKEKKIITLLLTGYSDSEIAKITGFSRQYINRIKKRIL